MFWRILFSVLLVSIIVAAFVVILYSPIKLAIQKKFTRQINGRRVYKLAHDKDYLVIHNYVFRLGPDTIAKFDHILFGDKFFYCIVDKVYDGGITGTLEDESWFFYPKGSKKKFSKISNPVKINHVRTNKFALLTGLEMSDLISIVLVNDDCVIDDKIKLTDHDYFIHLSQLEKVINEAESRSINAIEASNIEEVVQQIFDTNIVNKKKTKKRQTH